MKSKKLTYKELEEDNIYWIESSKRWSNRTFMIFMILVICFIALLLIDNQREKLQEENTQLKEQLNEPQQSVMKCFVIEKITTKWWDVENNIIVGEYYQIGNVTKENCEVLK